MTQKQIMRAHIIDQMKWLKNDMQKFGNCKDVEGMAYAVSVLADAALELDLITWSSNHRITRLAYAWLRENEK